MGLRLLVLLLVPAALAVSGCGAKTPAVACDPLGEACADHAKRCYPLGDGTTAFCEPPGDLLTGGTCTTVLGDPPECEPQSVCLTVAKAGGSTSKMCVQYCNLDGGAPGCRSGTCQRTYGVAYGTCF